MPTPTARRPLLAAVTGLAVALAAVLGAPCTARADDTKPAGAKAADGATNDTIVFRSGRVVQGTILEETPTTYTVRVIMGSLSADAVYQKDEILEVKRGAKPADTAEAAKPAAETRTAALPPATPSSPATDPSAAKIYIVEFTGEFGRDVSKTPLRNIIADIRREKPDYIVYKMDFAYRYFGQDRPDYFPDQTTWFGFLDKVRELVTIMVDEVEADPELQKQGTKIIAWVHRAVGAAAFVPLAIENRYYTGDARHGGIGYLERLLGGRGDEVVRQKMYSLLLGRAEGLGVKGKLDPRIVRAMSRTDYVLSVDFVGGEPQYFEDESGSILLTDDGLNENMDVMQDIARLKGNDNLILESEIAFKLGVSKGTVDDVRTLADRLGVGRNYTVIDRNPKQILSKWSDEVTAAEREFRRLFQEFQLIRLEAPGGYNERRAFRGKQLSILQQVKNLLGKYGEAINPREIQGGPEQWDTQIDLMIENIKREQRLDERERR